ncbi:MAG: DHH family phosphoesterase [Erysipelotrichaceae bacterium]
MERLFQTLIEQYDIITIFRHQKPDMDALGSQFGLAYWLKDNFKNKQIYTLGNIDDDYGYDLHCDEIDDEIIKNSLAIILDNAVDHRVDDDRYQLAKHRLLIDHHIKVQNYVDDEIVDPKCASTTQVLTRIFQKLPYKISEIVANLLYCGLMTDSLSYTTTNTTCDTLEVGAYLVSKGANIVDVNERISKMSYQKFVFKNWFLSNVINIDNQLCYGIITNEDIARYSLSMSSVKDLVGEIGKIANIEFWILFYQNEENETFNASIRSRKVPVNIIANKYGGGGHANAVGVKNLDHEKIDQLINDLISLIDKEK